MTNIYKTTERISQERISKNGGWIIAVPFFFMALSMLFSTKTFAQPFNVKGNVSTRTAAVRYASVTFVNTSDTSKHLRR